MSVRNADVRSHSMISIGMSADDVSSAKPMMSSERRQMLDNSNQREEKQPLPVKLIKFLIRLARSISETDKSSAGKNPPR